MKASVMHVGANDGGYLIFTISVPMKQVDAQTEDELTSGVARLVRPQLRAAKARRVGRKKE